MAKDLLVVLTKPARPGKVKTRLIARLGAEGAAELQAAVAADVLDRLSGGDYGLRIAWALDGDEPLPASRFASVRQRGGNLGERLAVALEEAAETAERVAAAGTDCPDLDRETVEKAFAQLTTGSDLVVAPALDGGYVLLALRREALSRELFAGVPWSTGDVLTATLERADRLGLRTSLLPAFSDLDTPADLDRLAARAEAGELAACPRTAGLLLARARTTPASASA